MWSSENLADYYRLLHTTEKCMTKTSEELENREIKNLLEELVEWKRRLKKVYIMRVGQKNGWQSRNGNGNIIDKILIE